MDERVGAKAAKAFKPTYSIVCVNGLRLLQRVSANSRHSREDRGKYAKQQNEENFGIVNSDQVSIYARRMLLQKLKAVTHVKEQTTHRATLDFALAILVKISLILVKITIRLRRRIRAFADT